MASYKAYKVVIQTIQILNGGKGGTLKEIRYFIQKNCCLRATDEKLTCAIKAALKKGISTGCLKRNNCTRKYFVSCKAKCPPSHPKLCPKPKQKSQPREEKTSNTHCAKPQKKRIKSGKCNE